MTKRLPIQHGDTGAIAKEKIEASFAELLENVQKFKPTIVDKVWYIGGISTGVPAEGKDIELGADQNYIKYRLSGGEWINLVSLSQLKGPKGDQGKDGPKGDDGNDGYGISSMQSQKVGDDTVVKVWYTDGSFNDFTIFGSGVSAGGQKVENMYVRNDDKNVITKIIFEDGTEKEFSVPKTNYGIGGGGGTASGNPLLSMSATNDDTNVYIHLRFVGDPDNPVAYTLPKADLGVGGGGGGGGGSGGALVNENGGTPLKIWAGEIPPAKKEDNTLYFGAGKGVWYGSKAIRPTNIYKYPHPPVMEEDVLEFKVIVNEGRSKPNFFIPMYGKQGNYDFVIAVNDGAYKSYRGNRGTGITIPLPGPGVHTVFIRSYFEPTAGWAKCIAAGSDYGRASGSNDGLWLEFLPLHAFIESENDTGDNVCENLFKEGYSLIKKTPRGITLPSHIKKVGNGFLKNMFFACNQIQVQEGFTIPQHIEEAGNDFLYGMFQSSSSGYSLSLPSTFNLPQSLKRTLNTAFSNMFYNRRTVFNSGFTFPQKLEEVGDKFAELFCGKNSETNNPLLPSSFNLPQNLKIAGEDFAKQLFYRGAPSSLPFGFKIPSKITSLKNNGRNFCSEAFSSRDVDMAGNSEYPLEIPNITGDGAFRNMFRNGNGYATIPSTPAPGSSVNVARN